MRRRGQGTVSDERILGKGEFVERVIRETERRERETLRLRRRAPELRVLLKEVAKREGLNEEALKKVRRRREVSAVLKVFCQEAVQKYGYSGASVARFLGVTTSLVNRYAASSLDNSP